MKESSVYKLLYNILMDKSVQNKFSMTQLRDKQTREVTATLEDCIKRVEIAYSLAIEEEKQGEPIGVNEVKIEIPDLVSAIVTLQEHYGVENIDHLLEELDSAPKGMSVSVGTLKTSEYTAHSARINFEN